MSTMSHLVSPTQLHYSAPIPQGAMEASTPTPDDKPSPSSTPSKPQESRKRKPWGADVGEIKIVIPPRKRAKTAEEKAQREQERTIRNRKAAEGSRQRSKEQYRLIQDQRDSLQQVTNELHQENKFLREALAKAGITLPPAFTFDCELLSVKPEQEVISDAAKKKKTKECSGTPGPTSAPTPVTHIKVEPISSLPTPPSQQYSPPMNAHDNFNSTPCTLSSGTFSPQSGSQDTPATPYIDSFERPHSAVVFYLARRACRSMFHRFSRSLLRSCHVWR